MREDEEGNEKRNPVQTLSLSLSLSLEPILFSLTPLPPALIPALTRVKKKKENDARRKESS